jgi:transposase-like protein
MERRKFTREFKLEAVRLIKDRGVSYVQASQDLSVHPFEPIRQRVGQRRDGELLLLAEDRAHQQQNVQDAQ